MDPNPKSFPILSYVMSRLKLTANPNPNSTDSFDIEQPPFLETMPHLAHPDLIASMATAVASVADARSVLVALGDRHDHESVDRARAGIAEADSDLSRRLEEIVRSPRPEGVDAKHWRARQAEMESHARDAAERARAKHKAVVELDEMHEEYGKLLKDAEERLVRIYEKHGMKEEGEREGEGGTEVNEEVIGILREEAATGKGMERVELSGRQLKFLPEAFGRMKGMVSLDVSNNMLEVHFSLVELM